MWEGILEALRDDPDDLTTHLVAADWLDDHGDAVRAEYVRAWARRPDCPGSNDAVNLHGRRWLGPASDLLRVWSFAGAGVGRLEFAPDAGEADVLPLLSRHAVRVLAIPPALAPRLAYAPALANTSGLEVLSGGAPWGTPDALFFSPHLGRLRRLDLGYTLTADLAALIARTKGLRNLRSLAARGTATDAAAVSLLRSRRLRRLEEWHVTGRGLTALSLLHLFTPGWAARWRAITHLSAARPAHLDGLAACVNLERLTFSVPRGTSADDLGRWIGAHRKMRELTLTGEVGTGAVRWLAGWPGLARLHKLTLTPEPGGLRAGGLLPLARSPFRSARTAFAFSNVSPAADGATAEQIFAGQEYAI